MYLILKCAMSYSSKYERNHWKVYVVSVLCQVYVKFYSEDVGY